MLFDNIVYKVGRPFKPWPVLPLITRNDYTRGQSVLARFPSAPSGNTIPSMGYVDERTRTRLLPGFTTRLENFTFQMLETMTWRIGEATIWNYELVENMVCTLTTLVQFY